MGSMNHVALLGRLTRDPEVRVFANGGKVASFGLAVDGKLRKDEGSGKYKAEPTFLDCEAYNVGNFKKADIIEQYCRKGDQLCVEGKLVTDHWTDAATGTKRSKIKVEVEEFVLVGGRKNEASPGNDGQTSGETTPTPKGADDIPF